MKRTKRIFFIFLMLLGFVFILVSCSGPLSDTFGELTHNHNLYLVEGIEATCQSEGLIEHYACHSCDKTFLDKNAVMKTNRRLIIDKEARCSYETVTTAVPTCTNEGEAAVLCKWCGMLKEKKTLSALGHSFGEWLTDTPAGCETDGLMHKSCSRCELIVEDVIPAAGHSFGAYATVINESCLSEGLQIAKCSVCGTEKSKVIPKAAHREINISGKPATCLDAGYTAGTKCYFCDTLLSGLEVIPAKGHSTIILSARAPGCTSTGRTEGEYCTICKIIVGGYRTVDALGHDMTINVEEVLSTCTVKGHTAGTKCSREGCEYTEGVTVLPLAQHTKVKDTGFAASCTSDGLTDGSHCAVCQTTLEAQKPIPAAHTLTYSDTNEEFHSVSCRKCSYEIESEAHSFAAEACLCARKAPSEGLEFTLSATGDYYILIGTGEWDGTELVIPRYYENLPVREIAQAAIYSDKVVSIHIPTTVETISSRAFVGCSNLSSLYVESIEDYLDIDIINHEGNAKVYLPSKLYVKNKLLTELVIPNGISKIKNYQFQGFTCIRSVTIPSSVTEIGELAFSNTGLVSLNIPGTVKTISYAAFSNNAKLSSLTIGNGVEKLSNGCFRGCTALKEVTVPDSVTVFSNVFSGCTALERISVPTISCNGANSFGLWFDGAKGGVPESLIYAEVGGSIGREAFYLNCPQVVVIKEGTTSIGSQAFIGASRLREVVIPTSVTSIGSYIFFGCTQLEKITVPFIGSSRDNAKTLSYFFSSTSVDYDQMYKNVHSLKEIIITDASSIADNTFYLCSTVQKVTISSSVTSIGKNAFFGTSLTEAVFENTYGWSAGNISVSVSNPANAAVYLTSTYKDKIWTRN